MTDITSLLTGGYYPLNTSPSSNNLLPAAAPTLADALSQLPTDSSTSSNSNNDAFLLDLSPQAQQILSGLNTTGGSAASIAANPFGSNFDLTADQQKQITAIIAKYKDAPYTQDTFNKIQNDLQTAGLSPNILSLQEQAKSFDPTLILIDALNGTTTDFGSMFGTSPQDEQSKTSGYMQQIIKQWQTISTTYTTGQGVGGTAGA